MASFAALTGQTLADGDGPDSFSHLDALLGKSKTGREWLVEQQARNKLALIRDDWKYIEPGRGPKIQVNTNTETGNDTVPQLYNLKTDLGERNNVAFENAAIVSELTDLLKNVREGTMVTN